MERLISSHTPADLCSVFNADTEFRDVSLRVAGSLDFNIETHGIMLSMTPCHLGSLIKESGADTVLFPEGTEEEVRVLVNFLYKGIKGFVSRELAQALGMRSTEETEEDSKVKMEGEVKMEVHEEGYPAPLYVSGLPVYEDDVSDDGYKPQAYLADFIVKDEYEENKGKKGKKRGRYKKLKRKLNRSVEPEEGEEEAITSGFQKQEHLQMASLLAQDPQQFRLYNRLVYSGSTKSKNEGETDTEFMLRMQNYNKFPGLIYNDDCTRFVVCVECGMVTKNVPVNHSCTRKVDYLLDKPIEIIKRLNKSKHLNKFFKQRADKVQCVECSVIIPEIEEFKVHLKEVHNIEPMLFKCNNQYGDFVCQDCGLRLVTKALLKRHEVTKHGKIELANFSCSVCNQYFITKHSLESHIKMMHEDYRPHVCEVCARSFKIKRHLLSHKLTHTGERSFECRHCDKRFAKEWTRKQHERLHLGVKPYACTFCDAKYSQKTSLDCHIRTHHSKPGL